MSRSREYRWVASAVSSSLLAVLLCAFVAPFAQKVPPLPPLTASDEAEPSLTRYQTEETPDIVLVGSSLTYRLLEEYFLPLKVRNLAIPGDSSLTGLKIIESYAQVPRVVLVEANILSRTIDTKLVDRFSDQRSGQFLIRPIKTAVAYLASAPPPHTDLAPAFLDSLLNGPPTDHENAAAVEWAAGVFSKSDQDERIRINATILAQLVSALVKKGSQIYLYELPLPEKISRSHFATLTRAVAHDAIPDSQLWLRFVYPFDQLRFTDHTHLDERSALIVAKSIEVAVRGLNNHIGNQLPGP